MSSSIRPLFLFSLPRAGSTLLQRILASHPKIATVSEPWLLLPLFYSLRQQGCKAEYAQDCAVSGIEDYCRHLPAGKDDYLAEIRRFAVALYAKVSPPQAAYFLDKTPRYHLIIDEIIRLFDDAKFVFLWRNPLAVAASIVQTWLQGRWRLHVYKIDLIDGMANLIQAYQTHAQRSYALRYEDLLADPQSTLQRVLAYLELEFDEGMLERFSSMELQGRLGDPQGGKLYQQISSEPLDKWKATVHNPVRKTWCRRYLNWIGAERLGVMGYDRRQLLDELKANPTSLATICTDLVRVYKRGYPPY